MLLTVALRAGPSARAAAQLFRAPIDSDLERYDVVAGISGRQANVD